MLAYRHAFHAGNHADVLKHLVLMRVLAHMNQKDKGYRFVDTHAGAGGYALTGAYAKKKAEFAEGIGRLWGRDDLPPAVAEYVDFVRAFNDGLTGLAMTVNGRPVDVGGHRHTSGLFQFQADPSLVGHIPDPCLTGGPQEAVVDGWGAMLQLAPGQHTVRVQAVAPWGAPFDYTWTLDVQR